MTQYLFIGGTNDGSRLEIFGDKRHVRLPVVQKSFSVLDAIPFAPIECEDYEKLRFKGYTCEFFVYIHSSLSPDQAMARMIDQYR